jgi:phosphate starvation-inducible protein PhoH and related proteins
LNKKSLEITPGIEPLYGTRDENLRLMEDGLHVTIDLRSDSIQITGDQASIDRVAGIFTDFDALRRSGVNLQNGELNGMLKLVIADPAVTLKSLVDSGKQRSAGVKRMVQPRSPNQRKYVEAIEQSDMTFGVGPAGTGKTYLAVAMAVSALVAKKVSRIILVRPAVEAGRTLNDAFIIMDEAQNTTIEQMKMFVTRLGNNSKAVITGDLTQTDLPNPKKSGLLDALNVLDGVEGIRFCHFEDVDVVRHHLVQRIVRAYDSYGKAQQQLPLPIGESVVPGTPLIAEPQTLPKPQ